MGVLGGPALWVGDADQFQQFVNALVGGPARGASMHLQRLTDLSADPHERIEVAHRVLRHQPDPRATHGDELLLGQRADIAAVEENAPAGDDRVVRQEAVHRRSGGALARPGLADDGNGLADAHVE
ncbi:MAG: hypothetical protein BWY91_00649 [bacterium ADurb.BinA028]|nr:MAG: hypothetical protein BWY91_00649 [bacterium ADurb.BinA028]